MVKSKRSKPRRDIAPVHPNAAAIDIGATMHMAAVAETSLALKLVGECGTNLSAWPSAKHFTSWLCLAPSNKIPARPTTRSATAGESYPICSDARRPLVTSCKRPA
jgi:hypothetical protein